MATIEIAHGHITVADLNDGHTPSIDVGADGRLVIDGLPKGPSLKGEDAEPVARYEIVPSDNSIMRDFKGALSPARLTARVFRDTGIAMAEVTLGGSNSLRYSIDGGTEQTYSPASGIATGGAKQKITLTFYVGVIRWASLDVPVHGIRAQLDGSGNLTIGEAVVNVRGPKPVLSLNAQHQLVADGVLVSDTVLKGADGITPEIDPTTKRWKIGGTLTQVKAEGTDGQPGTPGTPGKDFKYSDFTAAQLDALQSGVKSKIDTSTFRSDIGGLIKADVKDLLKGDSGFVALTKGEPGSKGDKGDKGDQGIQGLKGTDGISPHIGNDGYWYSGSTKLSVKAQGPIGPQGLQGPKGDQGLKGNDGAKGDKGDKGDKGLKGDTPVLSLNSSYQLLADGALVSSASLRGPQGIQGLKGDTGLQGPSGPQGIQGPTGPTGPQGKTFRPAWDGSTLTFTVSTDTSAVSVAGIAKTSDIPTKLSQLANDSGYSKFSGKYSDLIGPPSIPTKDTVANWGFATTSALNSGLAGKASLADVQGAGFVKYANGKLQYCSGLSCSDLNISSASHNHDSVYSKLGHTHSQYAAASHIHAVVEGTYSGNGGAKNPNAYGMNRVGFFMSSQAVNGNSQYKDWILLDCYYGTDVGGAVAIGVNRQSLGAYIMRSEAARTAWAASAELIGTHNYASILDGRYYTEAEVNSLVGGKVSKSGDTMSGALSIASDTNFAFTIGSAPWKYALARARIKGVDATKGLSLVIERTSIAQQAIIGFCSHDVNNGGDFCGIGLAANSNNLRLYNSYGGLEFNSNPVWHAGNDGSGSGLDADLLDGCHASLFMTHGACGWSNNQTVADWAKSLGWSNPSVRCESNWAWASSANLNVGGNLVDSQRYSAIDFRRGNLQGQWAQKAILFLPTYNDKSMIYIAQMCTTETAGAVETYVKRYADYDTILGSTVANASSLGGIPATNYITADDLVQLHNGQNIHNKGLGFVTTTTPQTITGKKTFNTNTNGDVLAIKSNTSYACFNVQPSSAAMWSIGSNTNNYFYFWNSVKSVEVVKIESDGNIKVGPGADSRYTNYSADGVRFQATSGGAGWASGYSYHSHDYSKHLGTSVGAYGGGDTLNWFFYGGSAYNNAAMYILPNKRVGIGTSSPQSPCHIQSSEQIGLRVNCTPSNGAALLLDNNGKGASIGINQYGLWMQNCAGTGQPYIQLLNDGGFVIQKSSGRYDILHDGNLYDYVPRVIYSAAGLIGNSAGFSPFGNTLTASLINVTFSKPSTNVVRITLGSALYAAKRLRCTVFPTAIFGGTFSPAHLGRTYGVSYLNVNGAGLDDCNGIVKYIDIYCCYNGAITSPAGYVQISIELLPPIL